jgi:pyridoxamine 5'-phosphate oxidase family protein
MSSPPNRGQQTEPHPSGVFTETELAYLATQRLGRLATAQPDGSLQNSPVGFDVNITTGTIDIYGYRLAKSQKYRNVLDNGRAAFVVDDIASIEPWRVRCLEIRCVAEAIDIDGQPLIRLHPQRVISFGLDQDVEAHELTVHSRHVPR